MATSDIRELTTDSEWRDAFSVVRQLRDHLDVAAYLDYLSEMREEGYRLFAVVADGEIVSVAGVAIRTNFYNGRHAFVYDLVTDADHRSDGYGTRLMQFLESWARDRGCESITLESGLWREDAHRFYEERLGMERFCYTFKKELEPN
ncbi:GNAT family N-acetyltransferase [Halobellus sp. Atlit-31R]|nr:GNAT family N-acetyltransferase [Halobellus sp. Atlit-31R]